MHVIHVCSTCVGVVSLLSRQTVYKGTDFDQFWHKNPRRSRTSALKDYEKKEMQKCHITFLYPDVLPPYAIVSFNGQHRRN